MIRENSQDRGGGRGISTPYGGGYRIQGRGVHPKGVPFFEVRERREGGGGVWGNKLQTEGRNCLFYVRERGKISVKVGMSKEKGSNFRAEPPRRELF